jgi:hypothetical protein
MKLGTATIVFLRFSDENWEGAELGLNIFMSAHNLQGVILG